jgi:TolB-like protein/DNA-binding winged helix-turn-helix (wHTH) protein/Tfp pilus assembly protein PilF
VLRFGAFEVDLSSGELRHRGVKLKVQEQPFRVLAALLEQPGEVVTREQLRARLWSSDTFVDFEHSLNASIKKLRQALRDDAACPHFIETLPKRGYRFIAAVETNSRAPHASEQTATPHLAHPAARRSIGRTAFLTGAIGIIVIATALPVLWKRAAGPVSRHSKIMLAVLPFDNLSSDRSQDYLTEGMTEELITQLGRWNPERLGVIARTSTDLYKGANKSVAEVGRQLSVDYIVEGSARRDGDQVRITAQLIQVRDQTHLWAKEYDRDENNILALENEVATDVADEIKVKLSANTKAEIRPVDAQAHEAYLKGRHYWNQLSCKAFENALPLFENAVQRDPNFALADASLADTYYKEYEFGCRPAEEVIPKAKQAALRAIQLDDQLGEAHAALGVIANGFDWNWVTAERELKLATELSPNNAIAHSWYGALLCQFGEWQRCFAEQRAAKRLDPVAEITNNLAAYMLYLNRQYDDAIKAWRGSLELHPNAALALWGIAGAYEQQGDDVKAAETYLNVEQTGGTSAAALKRLRAAIQRGGLKEYWKEMLRRGAEHNPPDRCSMIDNYAHLHDRQQTLNFLEDGYLEHCRGMARLKVDPAYDFVRSEPRFQAVLKKMAFPN